MGLQEISFPSETVFLSTGAAGFIGSNLCEAILKEGCKGKALDDFEDGIQLAIDWYKENLGGTQA